MAAVDTTGAPPKPAHGSRCPICNTGVLYVIAVNDDGEALRCFNCDTTGTVATEGDYGHVTVDDNHGPTGFQLSSEQLAAKREAGVDPYAPHDHPAFPASSSGAPASADEVEPHEQHDVVPPGDEHERGGGNGG